MHLDLSLNSSVTRHLAWELLLIVYRFESDKLKFVGGKALVGDVINVLGIFKHHLMANKLAQHLIETHLGVPRVFLD